MTIFTGTNIYKFFLQTLIITIAIVFCSIRNLHAQRSLNEIINLEREIFLKDEYLGSASINIDHKGDFIVTNKKSRKVSVFNSEGNLRFRYGRTGKGPGDFLHPLKTIRLSSGQLITGELTGKLSLFNPKGDSVIKIYNVKILPLAEIHQLDEERILLVGRKQVGKKVKLLHIFNLSEGAIIKSFFELPFSIQDYGGVFGSLASLPAADIKEGKIAAVIAPFLKVNIYDFDAKLLKSIDLPFEFFTKIQKVNHRLLTQELDRYLTTFSMIENIFWLNNNTFLISYFRFTDFTFPNVMERQNSLANVRMNGDVLFEIKETPKLKTVDPPYLYFENFNDNSNLLKGVISSR